MLTMLPSVSDARVDASRGVGAILCYDPYFTRMLRSVKKALGDGNPVMIRLHSAARYPIPLEQIYRVDLESHAVLIVGYDDHQSAIAISDPWTGNLHWLSYQNLSLLLVNGTKDCYIVPAPLDIDCSAVENGDASFLCIRVGFYSPDGIVMDRDEQLLTSVRVRVIGSKGWGPTERQTEVTGSWKVGEFATLSMRIPPPLYHLAEIRLEVSVTLRGERPYPYTDIISSEVTRRVNFSGVRQSVAV
jgi:hypothetical protein